ATTEIYTLSLHDALPIYVAHLVESRQQLVGRPELRQIEFFGLDLAWPERQRKLGNSERFPRSGRTKHGDRQGALGTWLSHIFADQGANAAQALDLLPVHGQQGSETSEWHT